ncbi:ATP synthase gamma chain [Fulvitalea axinellae]|uniref:ATP synthase gamma chain n=1 Tax=Fulvitalea axinellae TaxID=1182444 RepID=A0AAU9CK80_9BACT|nr:ATP synthase gamma chain [Fulvitalea axinellae]
MANLKEVKNRISSVQSTQQITKAMKMVAASKLRRAQERIEKIRPYADKLTSILENVSSGNKEMTESIAYAQQRQVDRVLLVVVTSDRGLCGAFNNNALKMFTQTVEENYKRQHEAGFLWVLPVGRKALEFVKRRGYQVISDYSELFHDLTFDTAAPAAELAMDGFVSGKYDKVEIIYNSFRNVAMQILKRETFLPIKPAEVAEQAQELETDYIYEPSKEFIVEELIPKSLKIQFYKAILDSNASEHGARMTAMEQATDNAGELIKQLQLTYNRTRQAAITNEILEIVAGAEALRASK